MAEQMRPASPSQAPDPATSYERAKPEKEAGMGRLDNNANATPENQPDRMDQAVNNKQPPRQVNAEDVTSGLVAGNPQGATGQDAVKPGNPDLPAQPDHSMFEEEPMGWDQAPTDIHDPERQRHPRTEGKGGTPDPGDKRNPLRK
jgi:hypothetical protein